MKSTLLVLIGLISILEVTATTIPSTIYINRGSLVAVDDTEIPYLAFNNSDVFDKENARIIINVEDTVLLTLINTDFIDHGFNIKGYLDIDTIVPASATVVIKFSFQSEGGHIYYDHTNDNGYRYMGLGGMIVVKNEFSDASRFFWNMKEHKKSLNEDIDNGVPVDWSTYYPEYFTINGNSNPHINDDPYARVEGNIGDTIHIYMVNTGQSLHSIHYHGYHAEILQSSKFPNHTGRSKDTFAIHRMEVIVVELVPHQPGEFPVHDHNLVAVSGGNIYPNGMFLTTLVE